jgi:hypothetical protein
VIEANRMSLSFAAAALKIGAPLGKFLLKRYLGEGAAASGGALIEIASQRITNEESQRVAARAFEDIGDKVVRRLVPLFEDIDDSTAEAIVNEVGLALAGNVSSEFFVQRDLDPANLGRAIRLHRPLPPAMFGEAEIGLYNRALDEAVRYIVAVADSLPAFDVQVAAVTLGRLTRIGDDLDKTLEKVSQIERLVEGMDLNETSRRYESDYRQSVQRNLDYLELFGADISPEAQRHSLTVGYVSLNFATSGTGQPSTTTYSADSLLRLLALGKGRMLLRGHAGSGKSTLFRWLAIEAALGDRSRLFLSWARVANLAKPISAVDWSNLVTQNLDTNWSQYLVQVKNWSFTDSSDRVYRGIVHADAKSTYLQTSAHPDWIIGTASRVPFLIRLRDCPDGRLPTPDVLPSLIANEIGKPPIDWALIYLTPHTLPMVGWG